MHEEVCYRFAHERIHQVVYALLPKERKYIVHQQIGRLLLEKTPPAEHTERIFDIVDQLNIGADHLYDQPQRYELAYFNLLAGRKRATNQVKLLNLLVNLKESLTISLITT